MYYRTGPSGDSQGQRPNPGGGRPASRFEAAARQEAALEVEGLYIISVAARLLEMHPQTLRKYERLGLITPSRTVGMLRLYSREDIAKLRIIRHLVEDLGLNLAGVELALGMVTNLLTMKRRLNALADSAALQDKINQEFALLFRNLNLALDE